MGESPHREYLQDQAKRSLDNKRRLQKQRYDMLQEMASGPGLGAHDGDLSVMEMMVVQRLQFAYEALRLLYRQ